MGSIIELHHAQITIPTGQEDAARHFYCNILGLAEVEKAESLSGRGGFWLQVGDRQIHVGVEDGVERSLTKAHLAYQVQNLKEMRNRLQAEGLRTTEGMAIPGHERFEFRDPFGNRLEFIQPS